MIRNEKGQLERDNFPAFTLTTACASIINLMSVTTGPIKSFTSVRRYFKCPYCDALSDTPGTCKNCGGVKEIWYG